MKKKIWLLIGILSILGIIGLGAGMIVGRMQEEKQQQIYEDLSGVISDETKKEPELSSEEKLRRKCLAIEEKYGIEIPHKEIDFEELRETVNEDIYAWIYVPETSVDYPIVQHPTDNTYYLNRNLDGSKGYPGCIFTENYNQRDFSDRHTVIYGHNMKDDTMFGELHRYEDSLFFQEQPYFFIYTEDDLFAYRIFRAYNYKSEHLLLNYDYQVEQGFLDYMEISKEYKTLVCNIDETILGNINGKNRICTLSTCVGGQDSLRYLVQGVLLDED